jgi:hypothetical protein
LHSDIHYPAFGPLSCFDKAGAAESPIEAWRKPPLPPGLCSNAFILVSTDLPGQPHRSSPNSAARSSSARGRRTPLEGSVHVTMSLTSIQSWPTLRHPNGPFLQQPILQYICTLSLNQCTVHQQQHVSPQIRPGKLPRSQQVRCLGTIVLSFQLRDSHLTCIRSYHMRPICFSGDDTTGSGRSY